MVKSVLSTAHQGLRDWAIQRLSAILMAIYSVGLIAYFVMHPSLSFFEWHTLFSNTAMKIATVLFILSIILHAWVGMWTIFTDYIKPFVLRLTLHVLVLIALTACFLWALLILWSI